jgi:hypothetical protein
MDLINQVYDTLKLKKGDEFCAAYLNIPVEKYQEIKLQIKEIKAFIQDDVDEMTKDLISRHGDKPLDPELIRVETNRFKNAIEYAVINKEPAVVEQDVNIENGTANIKGIAYYEPHTPEQIIDLLKIDTTKWRLSRYWSKQKSAGYWLVSALVSEIRNDVTVDLKKVLDTLKLDYKPIKPEDININSRFNDPTCAVISLQDIHVGKQDVDDTDSIIDRVKECLKILVLKAYHSCQLDKIIFVLGGDLVNMDTFLGTTTGGTPVENSVAANVAFEMAFDLMYWCINFLKQFCNTLEVVYIPGNHSRLTEAHIAYALSKQIKDSNIIWNIKYDEFKVITYGPGMLCFEHGDYDTKKSYFYFSSTYPVQWGATKYRTCYTGHFHKEKKIEYLVTDEINGFTLRTLPSLSGTDAYHKKNKWVNNKRGGIIELHSIKQGPCGTISHFE